MKNLIKCTRLFFALVLISTALSCGFIPKAACELTEADGKNILRMNVKAINKSDPVFGGAAAQNNKNLRACGYIAEKPGERGYLYWVEGKSENEQEAKKMFEISTAKSSDATERSVEELKLGDEARLIRYRTGDSNDLQITVRKGAGIFLISVSKPAAGDIPLEQVKSLAERIAGQITDY